MPEQTVPINEHDHLLLLELSRRYGKSVELTLSDAIRVLKDRLMLEATNAAYAELQRDSEVWREELEERAQWDATLSDGIDNV